jgi:hypothetical protein
MTRVPTIKRRFGLAALAVVSVLAGLAARPGLRFAAPADLGTFLVYTGGVAGRLDPCG